MAHVEGRLDKRSISRTQSIGWARGSSKAPLYRLHKNFGDKAYHCSPPYSFNEKQGKGLSRQPEVIPCVGDIKISRLLLVLDHTTGIRFWVDSSAQISIILATKEDKKRGPHKFTLQAVNKSLIQTYSQRCLTLNLGLKRVFTHIFVSADVEKAI